MLGVLPVGHCVQAEVFGLYDSFAARWLLAALSAGSLVHICAPCPTHYFQAIRFGLGDLKAEGSIYGRQVQDLERT